MLYIPCLLPAVTGTFLDLVAVYTFFWRRRKIRRKEEGFDDPYGPLALAAVMILMLSTIFVRSRTEHVPVKLMKPKRR